MIGSDDVLACFIAGNAFTWDDWFRLETLDDSLQPTIDMLLNVAIFMWFGAICPWYQFAHNNVIPIYRLIFLGILVLLLRRLPVIYALHKKIHQITEVRQALFVGFFGPIGVSAVFYLYITLEFLRDVQVDGVQREDAAFLSEVTTVVVWFLAICSIVVHGISIPLGKLGFYLPRTISAAMSSEGPSFGRQYGVSAPTDEPDFHPTRAIRNEERVLASHLHHASATSDCNKSNSHHTDEKKSFLPAWFTRFVAAAVRKDVTRPLDAPTSASTAKIKPSDVSTPQDPRPIGRSAVGETQTQNPADGHGDDQSADGSDSGVQTPPYRTASRDVGGAEIQHSPPRGDDDASANETGSEGTGDTAVNGGVWSRSIRFGDEGGRGHLRS